MQNAFLALCAALVLAFGHSDQAYSVENPEAHIARAGLTTVLGQKVDLSLKFTNSYGDTVSLGDISDGKRPIILAPVYFHCPRLCGLLLSGLTGLLNRLTLTLGSDYYVVAVSFDPTESATAAARRRDEHLARLNLSADQKKGWHFLVGSEQNVRTLMQQIGFNYEKDRDEFVHSAALMLLTPQGEIAQYFTGIDFAPSDVRLALVEASRGQIGSAFDHVMLFCFRFDPTKGKYTWAAFNVMRAGGAITLLALGMLMFRLMRRDREARKGV